MGYIAELNFLLARAVVVGRRTRMPFSTRLSRSVNWAQISVETSLVRMGIPPAYVCSLQNDLLKAALASNEVLNEVAETRQVDIIAYLDIPLDSPPPQPTDKVMETRRPSETELRDSLAADVECKAELSRPSALSAVLGFPDRETLLRFSSSSSLVLLSFLFRVSSCP